VSALAGIFDATYGRGQVAELVSGRGWLGAMLEVEAALARACAELGEIPPDAAVAIAAACRPERFDLAAIAAAGGEHATPVVPLVRALREVVGEPFGPFVHAGATSQDILDTAAMLLARRALAAIDGDLAAASQAAAIRAGEQQATPLTGRTLLQAALPISFGQKAAGWTNGLEGARRELERVRATLPVQMGGPVGSRGPAVGTAVAGELGLADPGMAWHTIRLAPACLAGALGTTAGVLGKVARDVTLLAQSEVGEASEGGGEDRGGSSAMAHKRNPVAAVSVLACTKRTPGLVATMLASMEQEHERAAGAWQAEWGTLSELLALTGSAAAWGRDLLEHVQLHPARMQANLDRSLAGVRP
jgi:3-carboxy-cis,cis-muconate cycloisomerase